MLEAAELKMQGEQVAEVPTEARKGQVIDLMAALKASLEKRGKAEAPAEEEKEGEAEQPRAAKAAARSSGRAAQAPRERRRAGARK